MPNADTAAQYQGRPEVAEVTDILWMRHEANLLLTLQQLVATWALLQCCQKINTPSSLTSAVIL